MDASFLPKLTERDDDTNSEGALDPLGLVPIADVLATKLIPGMRERQSHPRFLTACAVGTTLCEAEFHSDDVAGDGVTPPYLVFEWLTLEGVVRASGRDRQILSGFPGYTKAIHAIDSDLRLNAKTYLKTASVFGFFGIYRLLSRTLGLEKNGHLDDFGFRLQEIWEREQGLVGFRPGTTGPGADVRKRVQAELRKAFTKGCVDTKPSWNGWSFFLDHLHFNRGGKRERQLLLERLTDSAEGHRHEVFAFLSAKGKDLWESSEGSERTLYEKLVKQATPSLRQLLEVILAYETFARTLQDAFDDVLAAMTKGPARVSLKDIEATSPSFRTASTTTRAAFSELVSALNPFGESLRFVDRFSWVADAAAPRDWIFNLMSLPLVRVPDTQNPHGIRGIRR